jgi:hypothetical protein
MTARSSAREAINRRLNRIQVFAIVCRKQAAAHQTADLVIGDLDYNTAKASPAPGSAAFGLRRFSIRLRF